VALFKKPVSSDPDYVMRARMEIQQMLQQWLGSVEIDQEGDFIIRNGSSVTFGRVVDWSDGDAVFSVFSPVLVDVPITPQLLEYAATEFFMLGHMRVIPDETGRSGQLQFEYRIMANDIDPSELQAAVLGVASVGDALDDELQVKFGGKKITD
jgi:hypothetical protein